MSKDWYLIDSSNQFTSGYESDFFNEDAQNGFKEMLNTFLGKTITVYNNSDFNNGISKKAIIQNSSLTNKSNAEKKLLSVKGEIKTSNYIQWENNYWIVNSLVADNLFYDTSYIYNCPFVLKFQKDDQIYSYPYYVASETFSIDENKYIITSDTKRKIKLSFDNNTRHLKLNMRFMGDTFGDDIPQCWKITDISMDNGLLLLSTERDEYNPGTDNIDIGICNYKNISSFPTESSLIISGVNSITKLTDATFTINRNVIWTITNLDESSNIYVTQSDITDTSIKLTATDNVGKYIILTAVLKDDSNITTSKIIQIVDLF